MGSSASKKSRVDLKKSCPIGGDPILDVKKIKDHLENISKDIKKDNSLKKNLIKSVRVLNNEITAKENYENEKKKLEDNFNEKTKNLAEEKQEIENEKKQLNEKIEELERFQNEKLKEFELEKKKLQEELLQMKQELEEQKELRRKEQEQYEQKKIEDANLIKKEEEEKHKAEKEKLKNELDQARKEIEDNKKNSIEKDNAEKKAKEEEKVEEKKVEEKKPKSEEEEALDYLINYYKSGNQENPIISKINRELVQKVYKEIPSKSKLTLPKLINEIKEKSEKNNLSKENLIYLIYYWVTHNISYDTSSFFSGRNADCTPEGVFKNGCGVCSGYARFYKYLNDKFNIETQCITCYSKGYGYKVGEAPKSNHEYNAIKIDGNWYLIDTCWSAGHVNGTKFTFEFNEFYFCCPPEYFITNHYPDDKEWQLLPKKISVLQYQKFPLLKKHFFSLGFTMVEPFTNIIEGSGVISLKVYFGNEINSLYILSTLQFNKNEVEDCIKVTKKTNYFDIQIKLNNKGDYLLTLFGSPTQYGSTYNWIYDVKIVSKSKPKGPLKFH